MMTQKLSGMLGATPARNFLKMSDMSEDSLANYTKQRKGLKKNSFISGNTNMKKAPNLQKTLEINHIEIDEEDWENV